MNRQEYTAAIGELNAQARERIKTPVISQYQKIPADTEVYIRPIYEGYMLHFDSDLITRVEGTYAQLYGGNPRENDYHWTQYSTDIASWYNEDQLMPTLGRTLEQCREGCLEYFGKSYDEMGSLKKEAIIRKNYSCPLSIGIAQAFAAASGKKRVCHNCGVELEDFTDHYVHDGWGDKGRFNCPIVQP